jgi:DNA anti-recombination protein RmuC
MALNENSLEVKKRSTEVIQQGVRVKQEIADLNDGLKELVKTYATEIGVKSGVVNKAIRLAFKSSIEEEKEAMEAIENMLAAAGYR